MHLLAQRAVVMMGEGRERSPSEIPVVLGHEVSVSQLKFKKIDASQGGEGVDH